MRSICESQVIDGKGSNQSLSNKLKHEILYHQVQEKWLHIPYITNQKGGERDKNQKNK